jgi:hypothetical protein
LVQILRFSDQRKRCWSIHYTYFTYYNCTCARNWKYFLFNLFLNWL